MRAPTSAAPICRRAGNHVVTGFGSVAKYVATSIREAGYDVASMARTSTKIFVLEVMGRHAGWLAAACGLAAEDDSAAPHLILLPEVPFDEARFLERVRDTVARWGHCSVVVAEGLRRDDGQILSMQDRSQKGYVQLGGAGEVVAELIHRSLGYKVHYAVADYLQRSARHIASKTDWEQAQAVGKAAAIKISQVSVSGARFHGRRIFRNRSTTRVCFSSMPAQMNSARFRKMLENSTSWPR